jgi:tol-pal system protein YbgF
VLSLFFASPASSQSRELIQLQGDVVKLSSQVSQLQRTLDERNTVFLQLIEQVADQVAGLSASVERVTGTSESIQTNNQTLSGEIQVQFNSLRGELELMDNNIRGLGVRLDALSSQLTGLNTTSTSLSSGNTSQFLRAEADYHAGARELARTGFRQFISQNPGSPQAVDAQMYVANSFSEDGEFDLAILEYDLLLKNYPNSDRRSEALYKKALAYQKQNQPETALGYFEQVVSDFPESREASLAQDEILAFGSRLNSR